MQLMLNVKLKNFTIIDFVDLPFLYTHGDTVATVEYNSQLRGSSVK